MLLTLNDRTMHIVIIRGAPEVVILKTKKL